MVTRLKLKYDVATEQTRTEEKPCETFRERSLQNEVCEHFKNIWISFVEFHKNMEGGVGVNGPLHLD